MIVRWTWRAAWLLVPAALAVRHFAPQFAVLSFALACVSLVPLALRPGPPAGEAHLSLGIALVLLVMYGLSLLFQLSTQERVREEKRRARERAGIRATPAEAQADAGPGGERELQTVPRALL